MGPTEWTVISTGLVIIIANAATFRSLRTEMNSQRSELWSELKNLRKEMTEGFNALRKEMVRCASAWRTWKGYGSPSIALAEMPPELGPDGGHCQTQWIGSVEPTIEDTQAAR